MPTSLDELIYQTTQNAVRVVFRSLCRRDAISAEHRRTARRSLPLAHGLPRFKRPLNGLAKRARGPLSHPLPADTGPIASARKSFAFLGPGRQSPPRSRRRARS